MKRRDANDMLYAFVPQKTTTVAHLEKIATPLAINSETRISDLPMMRANGRVTDGSSIFHLGRNPGPRLVCHASGTTLCAVSEGD